MLSEQVKNASPYRRLKLCDGRVVRAVVLALGPSRAPADA
jgi:hypothetical protein